MSKTLLLDVNVLLGLVWPNHPFHLRATSRLEHRSVRWATCSLTQAAFIRLSSNPAVIPNAKSPSEAGQLLQSLVADPAHIFLEAKSGMRGRLNELLRRCHGHKQVNDAFLLWLADARGATLLTFDKQVQHLASAADQVEVLV